MLVKAQKGARAQVVAVAIVGPGTIPVQQVLSKCIIFFHHVS